MKEKFNVYGMTCSACTAHVEKSVRSLEGINEVHVALLQNTMVVDFDETKVKISQIIKAVDKGGYRAELLNNEKNTTKSNQQINENEEDDKKMKYKVIASFLILIPLMYITMGHMVNLPEISFLSGIENAVSFALTQMFLTLVLMYIHRNYFISGFKGLINRAPTMDSLIAIGSGVSFLYSVFATYQIGIGLGQLNHELVHKYMHNLYFESAAMILTLISLGKYLETRSKKKTTNAIARLMDLAPDMATVLKDDQEVVLSIEEIEVNDLVVIKPGERIPVDGIVVKGESYIDESALTGESIPVKKGINDKIMSATLNKQGHLIYKATKVGKDTTLSKIIELVEEAASSKAPISKLADKVSAVFVPIVIGISILTVFIWLLAGESFNFALSNAIAVLVISCPCALGLATPTAIMVGTGKASEYGILIKSAESLEIAHSIDTVVLDKTGTITEGKMSVSDIVLEKGMDELKLLSYLASIEAKSNHPLALAVVEEAKRNGRPLYSIDDFKELSGLGVVGKLEGFDIIAGNKKLMNQYDIDIEQAIDKADQFAMQGKTPIYVSYNGELLGIIAISDQIKKTSKKAIDSLNELGIDVMMLTGDHRKNAEAIKNQLNIQKVYAEVLPQDKERIVRELVNQGKVVAMVGDGINDAPALVSASIGISIGAGSDIAIDSSDIVLIKNELLDVVTAIELSDSVMRNIKQNLFWAFIYNVLGIPLAMGLFYPLFGWSLNPMFGAAAMSFSSVSVVSNALRLRFFKPKFENLKAIHQKRKKRNIKERKEEEKMEKVLLIEGMSCQMCVKHVQKAIDSVEGVSGSVDLENNCATISCVDESKVAVVKEAIKDAGYDVIGEK